MSLEFPFEGFTHTIKEGHFNRTACLVVSVTRTMTVANMGITNAASNQLKCPSNPVQCVEGIWFALGDLKSDCVGFAPKNTTVFSKGTNKNPTWTDFHLFYFLFFIGTTMPGSLLEILIQDDDIPQQCSEVGWNCKKATWMRALTLWVQFSEAQTTLLLSAFHILTFAVLKPQSTNPVFLLLPYPLGWASVCLWVLTWLVHACVCQHHLLSWI